MTEEEEAVIGLFFTVYIGDEVFEFEVVKIKEVVNYSFLLPSA